jgi:MFS-type transporter involved in bile tolerance (Atg22 family)
VELIPRGQEAEMMGLFIFVGQALVWLPPLFFGVLNEAGASMKWGLVLDACFFVAAGALCWRGVREGHAEVLRAKRGGGRGRRGGSGRRGQAEAGGGEATTWAG